MKVLAAAATALLLAPVLFAATEKRIDRPAAVRLRAMMVNLDVKDGDVRDVMKSMQRQCGIKNLVIDPHVEGKATFFMRDIPCSKAFEIVLRTYGLKSVNYSSSVAVVEKHH
jgi:CO dehydrogenase/acetyl-CoA synthase gamma subunit (corrinoid Fe-S protein)